MCNCDGIEWEKKQRHLWPFRCDGLVVSLEVLSNEMHCLKSEEKVKINGGERHRTFDGSAIEWHIRNRVNYSHRVCSVCVIFHRFGSEEVLWCSVSNKLFFTVVSESDIYIFFTNIYSCECWKFCKWFRCEFAVIIDTVGVCFIFVVLVKRVEQKKIVGCRSLFFLSLLIASNWYNSHRSYNILRMTEP